jgi:LPXTG-site transpeptidase (sortase) family protein
MIKLDKISFIKALVIALELLAVGIIIYLLVLPLWPALIYKFNRPGAKAKIDWQNITEVKEQTRQIISHLPAAAGNLPDNRVIIPKISLSAPIAESADENYGLSRGAWRLPKSSTPDKGGNTVITGHRFKYLPPNNLTFYLLDKLTGGDIISLIWENKEYDYKIKESKIVPATEVSILNPSEKSILTLFTCDPIWSEKNRLVVVAELIKE